MEILDPLLQAYLDAHCDEEPEALRQINRETHLKMLRPHMMSGHYQGRLLSFLSKMMRPKHILEIGTFTGYATICLAEGLVEGGKIETIEVDREMEDLLKSNFSKAGIVHKVNLHIGDAKEIIFGFPDENFDIAFIDADKKSNMAYYEALIKKIKPEGLIIIDNVLWKGKVYGEQKDTDTESFRKLNDHIAVDKRVEKLILPVRDGIMIVRKI